jgi:GntR family transcriptional regulator
VNLELKVERDAEVPVGTQLVWQLRGLMKEGRLRPGDRLPSLRDAAAAAGVNVNTMRAVYARLESEGLLRGEQGRGTFVARQADEPASRRALRREIAQLDAELVRHPPPPISDEAAPARPALLSTADLASVRDQLRERLRLLDSERAELLSRLDQLEAATAEELEAAAAPAPHAGAVAAPSASRRSTPSLTGARIRWVGA